MGRCQKLAFLLVAFALAPAAWAQRFTLLHAFAGGTDGSYPSGTLFLDPTGNLYGLTAGGGTVPSCPAEQAPEGCGTVFEVSATGTESVVSKFAGGVGGQNPEFGALIRDASGNFYGTTLGGGAYGFGTVFKLTTTHALTVLYSFTGGADGAHPFNGLTWDAAGNLFGTTFEGGAYGAGVVFELGKGGVETVVHSFTGGTDDGGYPYCGLIRDPTGNLYGTTTVGGAYDAGVVFELSLEGVETVLYSFTGGIDGGYPYAGVILDRSGNLYGTTVSGGQYGYGIVFEIAATGGEAVLHSFTGGIDGRNPYAALVLGGAGYLYGTTTYGGAGAGNIFRMSIAGVLTTVYSFTGGTDGEYPFGGVVRDAAGNLYGTTGNGGKYGLGTVYKITQ